MDRCQVHWRPGCWTWGWEGQRWAVAQQASKVGGLWPALVGLGCGLQGIRDAHQSGQRGAGHSHPRLAVRAVQPLQAPLASQGPPLVPAWGEKGCVRLGGMPCPPPIKLRSLPKQPCLPTGPCLGTGPKQASGQTLPGNAHPPAQGSMTLCSLDPQPARDTHRGSGQARRTSFPLQSGRCALMSPGQPIPGPEQGGPAVPHTATPRGSRLPPASAGSPHPCPLC